MRRVGRIISRQMLTIKLTIAAKRSTKMYKEIVALLSCEPMTAKAISHKINMRASTCKTILRDLELASLVRIGEQGYWSLRDNNTASGSEGEIETAVLNAKLNREKEMIAEITKHLSFVRDMSTSGNTFGLSVFNLSLKIGCSKDQVKNCLCKMQRQGSVGCMANGLWFLIGDKTE